ncbi:helix-turn-helix domain-containing protein [Salinisphaera sp. T31B1]|uniref:helix-turn-helix domain-containing protein n=1 Tax=Salinisphaera sp. T31B1 TaxID=727963 RepID=UPI0033418C64
MTTPRPAATESRSSASGGVAAVDRALQILTAVESASESPSLSELSRVTGFYKSTILRLIVSLERAALIVQRPDLRYELGPLAFRLGRAYDASHQLEEHVLATLHRLVERDTQSASFHMRYNDRQRLCLFRVNSHHSILDNVKTGDLLPLSHGAPAKVIQHFHPLSGQALDSETPLLFRSTGERDPSCAAVAAPVFAAHGLFVGALSLSGPRACFDDDAVAWMSDVLVEEARQLTTALGGDWPAAD